MSYFDDASLVMIPSGYKTSKVYSVKPTSGDGDLTFTRSNDTATRVGPDGLIEKVRTNLILQSNTFSAADWVNDNTSETSGQAGYDGTNNAWLLDSTGGYIVQAISASGLNTFSVYAKKGTAEGVRFRLDAGTDANCYINLNDGTEINPHTGVYLSVVSVGSGWYRIGLAINDPSLVNIRIHPTDLSGSSTTGNIYIQNAMLESGDVMTDYIATTSAAVSVGPVANVPRLDYLGSSCPRLLLEPQRTNLVLWSESFDNAGWTKGLGALTPNAVTANYGISPDGYQNADRIQMTVDGSNTVSQMYQVPSVAAGTYTVSVYLKALTGTPTISIMDVSNVGAFGLVTLTNEWQRYTYTFNAGGAGAVIPQFLLLNGTTSASADFLAYGFQLEASSYATSYIPTLGSASTRGSDSALKTGIASLIGQSEGTLFLDFIYKPVFDTTQTSYRASISDGTYTNRVSIVAENSNTLSVVITGVNLSGSTFPIVDGQRYKVAIGYGATTDVYINGAKVYSYSSGTPTGTYTRFQFSDAAGLASRAFAGPINQALLFPTRLSNADLAALTA